MRMLSTAGHCHTCPEMTPQFWTPNRSKSLARGPNSAATAVHAHKHVLHCLGCGPPPHMFYHSLFCNYALLGKQTGSEPKEMIQLLGCGALLLVDPCTTSFIHGE